MLSTISGKPPRTWIPTTTPHYSPSSQPPHLSVSFSLFDYLCHFFRLYIEYLILHMRAHTLLLSTSHYIICSVLAVQVHDSSFQELNSALCLSSYACVVTVNAATGRCIGADSAAHHPAEKWLLALLVQVESSFAFVFSDMAPRPATSDCCLSSRLSRRFDTHPLSPIIAG